MFALSSQLLGPVAAGLWLATLLALAAAPASPMDLGPTNTTPPLVQPTLSGPLGNNGWYTGPVNLTWSLSDSVTSSTGCGPTTLSQDTPGTVVTCSATNGAGLQYSVSITVRIDQTKPTISVTRTPPANFAGWNTGQVTVSFLCADAGSGLPETDGCTGVTTVTQEGADQAVTRSATDKAGNTAIVTLGGINIDKTAPVTTASVQGTAGADRWYRAGIPVTVTLSASDALSGVAGTTYSLNGGAPQRYTGPIALGEGMHRLAYSSTDRAGNVEPAKTLEVKVDPTGPSVVCQPADGAWHATDVSRACSAADGTSGLASPADASFALSTSVPDGVETADAMTGMRTVCDAAGNCTEAGPLGGNRVDKKAPEIAVTAPTGTVYTLNQLVAAIYACWDGGSGVATCSGPVPSGANINTASVGWKTFVVRATDAVGNSGNRSVSYTVAYNVCLLYDPTRAVRSGSTISIKLQLCDARGANVSDPGIPVTALNDPGPPNPDNYFQYVASLGGTGGYVYNVSTMGLQPGTYTLSFRAGSDPTVHAVQFQVQ